MQAIGQMVILTALVALLATTVEQSIMANAEKEASNIATVIANKIFS